MANRMNRVDPQQNMARWYEIDVQPMLLGEFTVERRWGRIGAAGQSKTFWFSNEDADDEMAEKFTTMKVRRGYLWPGPSPYAVS